MHSLLPLLQRWLSSIEQGIIALTAGFIIFSLLERIYSFRRLKKPVGETLVDLQFAFTSMLYPPFIYFILSALFAFIDLQLSPASHDIHISPVWFIIQLIALLFIRDCLIYLRHYLFHLRPIWAFHSIHHSSEEVNWLSAVRFHPLENTIEATGEILLFLIAADLGLDFAVLSAAGLIIGFYNLFIHSNLRWTFGPLRYVLVSPVFHRWHHSDTPAAQDKNFAAMFSCLDWALGTFYMPKDLLPETTGLSGEERNTYPRGFTQKLLYPFKKR